MAFCFWKCHNALGQHVETRPDERRWMEDQRESGQSNKKKLCTSTYGLFSFCYLAKEKGKKMLWPPSCGIAH